MEKEFVEIAGIKWATKNVGAEKETDTGLYFQWGDTQGYTADEVGPGEDENLFKWESYKYGNGVTKYNKNDGKVVLEASDDAVTAALEEGWRMPTKEEFHKLSSATTNVWTRNYKDSGVNGMLFTDKTDPSKTLFFPACGFCDNGIIYYVGSYGYYWSSSLFSEDAKCAYILYFNSGYANWKSLSYRLFGFPVRGVMK